MKLWLLESKNDSDYDCAAGFVVGAEDAFSARRMAAEQHGDEGAGVWLSPWESTCYELTPREGVILRDFHAA